jgi:hypothetical protein
MTLIGTGLEHLGKTLRRPAGKIQSNNVKAQSASPQQFQPRRRAIANVCVLKTDPAA